jgi:hypothetical protein
MAQHVRRISRPIIWSCLLCPRGCSKKANGVPDLGANQPSGSGHPLPVWAVLQDMLAVVVERTLEYPVEPKTQVTGSHVLGAPSSTIQSA